MNMIIQPIIRGDSESAYPSVCRVALVSNYGLEYTCTGTLIAPDLVLCAAHCVDAPRIHSAVCIFGDREVSALRWFWSRDFDQPSIESGPTEQGRLRAVGSDFTVLQLATPIFDIEPSPMMRKSVFRQLVTKGAIREITAVGFGRFSKHTSTDLLSGTEKRSATFRRFSFPAGTETMKIYPDQKREGEPVSISVGDSGGPYFASYRGRAYVVATVSTVTHDSKGDAKFATALSVDAPIDFFKSTLFTHFSQSIGPMGYGYVKPRDIKINKANVEKTLVDENQCLHGFCPQEKPLLFGGLAIGSIALCTSLVLRIRDAQTER